jgi:hypothetical protein
VLDRLIGAGPGPSVEATAGIRTSPLVGVVHRLPYVSAVLHAFPPPRRVRPGRRLDARHRAALRTLRRAGASDLPDDFLVPELKSAFRRLARDLHPDMHPDSSPDARARLAAAFHQVREAYRTLQTAPLDGV